MAARKLCALLAYNISLSEEDAEITAYGLECLLSDAIQILALIVTAFLTRSAIEVFSFTTFFMALKRYAGGYHAPNHFLCITGFTLACAAAVISAQMVPVRYVTPLTWISLAITMAAVLARAPVVGLVNPKSQAERKQGRKQSIRVTAVQACLITFGGILLPGIGTCFLSAAFGCLTVAATLFIPYERRAEQHENKRKTTGH